MYETEDNAFPPGSGLFRYVPDRPGDLLAGGRLQLAGIAGNPQFELFRSFPLFTTFDVVWYDIDGPNPDPDDQMSVSDRDAAVFDQGLVQGGAIFNRLEGCWFGDGKLFFHDTRGGAASRGQVWQYDPVADQLTLIFESPGMSVLDSPDNITVSPNGQVVGGAMSLARPNGIDGPSSAMDLERIRHIRHRPPPLEGRDGAHPVPESAFLDGKTVTPELLGLTAEMDEIWVADVNEASFPGIIDAIDPRILNLYGLRVADLSPLAGLSRLEALVIEWDTRVTDIAPLARLTGLSLLALSDVPKVTDIAPLASLTDLEGLELSGGIWNVFHPATLEPLAALTNLTEIRLAGIRVGDQSLAPLEGLERLRRLDLSNQFPTEEFARLSVALPNARCDLFAPYVSITAQDVMITGKGKPFLAWDKDAKRIRSYEEKFHALQEKAREDLARP